MGRLFEGEKLLRLNEVVQLLKAHSLGLEEAEIAGLLGWERRTVNNYLRELESYQVIYKEDQLWFAEE